MERDGFDRLTIWNLLQDAASRHEDKEIVYRKERRTFREFRDRVQSFAAGLQHIVGVKKGDVVACLDWDTMRYLEAYYAVPSAGGVLHTVNIRYPPELIYYTMSHASDSFVIIRDEFVPMIEKFKDMFSFVKGWIVYSDDGAGIETSLKPLYRYEEVLTSGNELEPNQDENSRATIFYTSGTTGMPKGVTFTQRQIVLHSLAVQIAVTLPPLNITTQDVAMPLVPMFHVHTWGLPFSSLVGGMKYVLPGRYDFQKIPEIIDTEGVTLTASVPSILYMLLNSPTIMQHSGALGKLKALIGGASLPTGLARKAEELGITVVGAYGLSETCPALTISNYNDRALMLPEEKRRELRYRAGVPFPFVSIRVVNEDFKDVPKDGKSVGEIVVRAPWLTEGYYRDEAKTAELWKGGWLHTGDLGVIDEYGYLLIVDREKDAVKSGGEFIPSLIVESAISEMKGIGEVAIIGVSSEQWGERPVAVATRAAQIEEKDVINHLNKYVEMGRIQKWWIPDRVIFVDAIPKTSTGKADKKKLKEMVKL